MSANLYKPHLQVLLEDDANRQIALGFINHHAINSRQMPLDRVCGGWREALKRFREEEVPLLRKYPERRVLIVIDFDGQRDRFEEALSHIPEDRDVRERVYVLGCLDEPERLAVAHGCGKERIGELLAEDCAHDRQDFWNHPMLAHNAGERRRLWATVRQFLVRE